MTKGIEMPEMQESLSSGMSSAGNQVELVRPLICKLSGIQGIKTRCWLAKIRNTVTLFYLSGSIKKKK